MSEEGKKGENLTPKEHQEVPKQIRINETFNREEPVIKGYQPKDIVDTTKPPAGTPATSSDKSAD